MEIPNEDIIMYTAIKGMYENGQVILQEPPPTRQRTKVVVMFLAEDDDTPAKERKGVRLGSLAGRGYRIPDDFDDPLDDLSEYL
jgi:hypothetical protein